MTALAAYQAVLTLSTNESFTAEARQYLVDLLAEHRELRTALRESADRLEVCAQCNGNDPQIAASAVAVYRELIAKVEAAT